MIIELLVWLVGISTTVSYLMPNPLYTYMLNMICKHILLTFLNEPEPIFCKEVKWFRLFLFTINHFFAQS